MSKRGMTASGWKDGGTRPFYMLLSLMAGVVLPVQGRLNAGVAEQTGDPIFAGLLSLITGALTMVILTSSAPQGRTAVRRVGPALRSRAVRWWYPAVGVAGAYLVLTQTWVLGATGVAVFTIAMVTGQVLGGLTWDRLGFTDAPAVGFTMPRVLGTVVAVCAVTMSLGPRLSLQGEIATLLLLTLFPFLAGVANSGQQVINGRQTVAYGNALPVGLLNYLAGTAALGAVFAVTVLSLDGFPQLPNAWWLYGAGPLGCVFIVLSALLIPRIGALVTALGGVAGQLIGSLLLDLAAPVPGSVISPLTVGGAVAALIAVALVSAERAARSP